MWWHKKDNSERDINRLKKVEESQSALINAVTSTADAAQDVTTALKERLDDSLKQLEYTANLLSDALITCQPDGTLSSVNPAAERMFGWKAHEAVGMNISILFRKDNGRKISASDVINTLQDHHSLDVEDKYSINQLRGKRRTGELFHVDGDITHLERLDGSKVEMILIKDITTRIEIQKQLNISETRYRSIFENNIDGIVVIENYHIVAANPAMGKLLGYSPEEMIAKPGISFLAPEHHQEILDMHGARLKGDSTPHSYIAKWIHRDGSEQEMMMTSTLMQWEGRPASLIAVKDVTAIMKVIADRKR